LSLTNHNNLKPHNQMKPDGQLDVLMNAAALKVINQFYY
jgi:hypothetical protein